MNDPQSTELDIISSIYIDGSKYLNDHKDVIIKILKDLINNVHNNNWEYNNVLDCYDLNKDKIVYRIYNNLKYENIFLIINNDKKRQIKFSNSIEDIKLLINNLYSSVKDSVDSKVVIDTFNTILNNMEQQ